MPERSPAEAVEIYRQSLQRILSCVTDRILTISSIDRGNPYLPGDYPHVLVLSEGRFAPLSGNTQLALRVAYRYEIGEVTGPQRLWEVRTREYTFSLATGGDRRQEEIIAYHSQPDAREGKTWPHLHIGPAMAGTSLQLGSRYAHRIHFPTGLIPLSLVIRMAIEEFGVHPLREDWQQVLTQEQAS